MLLLSIHSIYAGLSFAETVGFEPTWKSFIYVGIPVLVAYFVTYWT